MKIFETFNLSGLNLSSRIVMAPLTRRRATDYNVPVPMMAEYYGQRAGAGLIIAEGTSPSQNGVGYCNMPALYNLEHAKAWKKTTDQVHELGGKIFLQVMHTGRVGHKSNLPGTGKVLAPSAIAQKGEIGTYKEGKQPYTLPKEMSLPEILHSIDEFVNCAKLSMEAGFDGIEIHGAHGYLPNQFLNKSSNIRTDIYGGSTENRMRFMLQVLSQCCDAIGSNRAGLRISPYSYADMAEDLTEVSEVFTELTMKLNSMHLAYVHLSHMGEPNPLKFELWKQIREIYTGTLILCGDFTKESAETAIGDGAADLIAFGRDFISNADLVNRFKENWPLNDRDRTHWYTSGSKGYTSYYNYDNSKL